MSSAMIEQTRSALAAGAREARGAWHLRTTLAAALVAAALLAPAVLPLGGRMPDVAAFVYLAVAAVGLTYAVGLAGALAALAAVAAAPSAPFSVETGTLLGLKGLVAAMIVRFGSPWAAFAAGLAVGLAEAAIDNLRIGDLGLGAQYGEILPLAFALALIAYRSLRAEPDAERA